MPDYTIRSTIIPDVQLLSRNLRKQDKEEVRKLGSNPRSALMQGYLLGECYTGLHGGDVLAIFGVVPVGPHGRIWMLCSPLINKHLVTISRESRAQVQHFAAQYRSLFNIVDQENTLTMRWLKGLGFTIGDTVQIGPNGHNFKEFYLCPSL